MTELGSLRKAALTWGPAFVGGFIWSYAKFPEQLAWAADAYAKAFSVLSTVYEEWTRVEGYGEALDAAIDEIRKPPTRVLDVATGTGYVARRIAAKYPEAEVIGVDITPEMVAVAQHQTVADATKNLSFQVGDSADLPFDDHEFDLVTLQNSIVHPEEMMRVLRPGGRALIVFSFAGPWVMLAWSAISERLEAAGAAHIWASRAGAGFFGVARK